MPTEGKRRTSMNVCEGNEMQVDMLNARAMESQESLDALDIVLLHPVELERPKWKAPNTLEQPQKELFNLLRDQHTHLESVELSEWRRIRVRPPRDRPKFRVLT